MNKHDNFYRFKTPSSSLTRAFKFSTLVGLATFCIILSGSLFLDIKSVSDEAIVIGAARVIDGDTLDIQGNRIRIHGIDTPESRQTCLRGSITWLCGQEASALLRELTKNTQTKCERIDTDRYNRIVGKCFADGKDVGEEMVRSGMALAYRQYSKDYVSVEAAAKAASKGLWSGQFIAPWDWRRGKRISDVPANDNSDCQIKGNISRNGERIYHMPSGQFYARTKISRNKGERWFCSENEAREAGWRASKR